MASNRTVIQQQLIVGGIPTEYIFIENFNIDDVVTAEARVQATSIETNNPALVQDRVVARDIRNFLIKLGIEQ
jgi:hypothetical protein